MKSSIKSLCKWALLIPTCLVSTLKTQATINVEMKRVGAEQEIRTSYLDSVYTMSYELYLEGDVDESRKLQENLIQLAQKSGDLFWEAKLKMSIGINYYNKGDFDRSLKYFIEVYDISSKLKYEKLEAWALNYIGKYYHSVGNLELSYEYYMRTLKLANKIKDTVRIASVTNNIGKHFISFGEITKGLGFCMNAYNLQKKQVLDEEVFSTSCNHIGGVYLKLNEYEKALHYHSMALKERRSIHYSEGIGKSYQNISKVYYRMGLIDSAEYYSNKALALFEKVSYAKGEIKSCSQLSLVAMNKRKFKTAEKYLNRALILSEQTGYDKGRLNALYNIGKLKYQIGNYPIAIQHYLNGVELAEELQNKELLRNCCEGVKECYEQLGEYKKANEYGNRYLKVSEELTKEGYNNQIASLRVAFETERKEQENKVLQKENELKTLQLKQKNLLIILFIITLGSVVVLVFVMVYRYFKKQQANTVLSNLNGELLKANREKDKFFSIIAHEIRNPLWWFKNITETLSLRFETMSRDEVAETLRTMDESAKNTFLLMDNLLHWTRSRLNIIPFKPVKTNVSELINQNIRLFKSMIEHKKIELQISLCKSSLILVDQNQVNTIIRNILSNAIKFTPELGKISIKTQLKGQYLNLTIEDSGVGIEADVLQNLFDEQKTYSTLGLMQEKGSGIGLKMSKEFAEKNRGELTVKSIKEKGTLVEVKLPLCKEDE